MPTKKYLNEILGNNRYVQQFERMQILMAAKLKAKEKSTLSSMQAVTYQREFKMADKAAQRKETKR